MSKIGIWQYRRVSRSADGCQQGEARQKKEGKRESTQQEGLLTALTTIVQPNTCDPNELLQQVLTVFLLFLDSRNQTRMFCSIQALPLQQWFGFALYWAENGTTRKSTDLFNQLLNAFWAFKVDVLFAQANDTNSMFRTYISFQDLNLCRRQTQTKHSPLSWCVNRN